MHRPMIWDDPERMRAIEALEERTLEDDWEDALREKAIRDPFIERNARRCGAARFGARPDHGASTRRELEEMDALHDALTACRHGR